MTKIQVALIQNSAGHDVSANLADTIAKIKQAAKDGAQLVMLQELHNSVYFCQQENAELFDLAETIPGPSTEKFSALAKELDIVLVASLFEKRAKGLYHNTAVVFDGDRGMVGKYRKMHIPDDPGYYEKFYFTPGDLGFTPINTRLGKLGVLVCWDQWYPEAARLMAMAGADLLLYPTAIGWHPYDEKQEQQRQLNAWQTIQRAHAVANGIPVLSCNRVGFEKALDEKNGIQFWGHSFIVGPQGEILAQADEQAQILTATVDLQRSENVRRMWPFFRDRRIDYFEDLAQRYLV